MAEQRTEHTDIVGAPIAGADHGLFVQLIGPADTRRPIESVLGISGQVNAAYTAHESATGGEIDPRPVARLVDRLRVDHVEAQPVIECQLWGRAPGILGIVEVTPLPLTCIKARTYIPAEGLAGAVRDVP